MRVTTSFCGQPLAVCEIVRVVQFEEGTGSQVLNHKAEQEARTEVKQEYGQTRSLDGIAIARAEMARRRRKLGTLTRGQELAIENLLLSTATRISELVGKAFELHPTIR